MRFLFYDKILLLEKGNRIIGVKNAALNEDFLTGHFQKVAIMPGSLLIEAVAQVAGWLVNASMDFKVSALMSLVEGVKFIKDVRPGDKIILEAEILNLQDDASEAKGCAKVDGEIVMTVDRILFYCYRCEFGMNYPSCDIHCATNLENTIKQEGEENIGGFVLEPVMAFAGGIIPPADYFPKVREICDKHGLFLILDEITTGFGRLGTMFAADYWNIKSDIMTLSKGINSGYLPLGATLATDEIYDAFIQKGEDSWVWANQGIFAHGSTTDGHPVCCASALANIKLIEDENLVENSKNVGAYLLDKLKDFLKYPFVGEVRGLGLLIAIEFVNDKKTREALPPEQVFLISTRLFKSGLFAYSMGNTITLFPPLIFSKDNADETYEIFENTLSKVQRMITT